MYCRDIWPRSLRECRVAGCKRSVIIGRLGVRLGQWVGLGVGLDVWGVSDAISSPSYVAPILKFWGVYCKVLCLREYSGRRFGFSLKSGGL